MEKQINSKYQTARFAFLVAFISFLIALCFSSGFAFAGEWAEDGGNLLVSEFAQGAVLQAQSNNETTSYAVLNGDVLTFVRSADQVENGTKTQINGDDGKTYSGTVYTGFEEAAAYTGRTKAPWYKNNFRVIKSVVFVSDIAPKSTAHWFDGYTSLTSVDLSGLNTTNTESMDAMLASKNITTLTFGPNFILSSDSNAGLAQIVEGTEANEGGYYTGKWEKSDDSTGAVFDSEELMQSCVGSSFAGTYTRQIVNSAENFAFAILYDDGELVFQRGNATDASRSVAKIYPGVESSASKPWSTPDTNNFKVVTFVDCSDTSRGAIKPINMANWFTACGNLSQINGACNIDVSSVSSMENLFNGCNSLGQVDLSTWRPVSATSFRGMFTGCKSLASVDLREWKNDRASTTAFMFSNCTSLTAINLSGLNTSAVTDMEGMFSNCEILETLDLSDFDTSNVSKMANMFYRCYALKGIEFGSSFNTSSVTDMSSMFHDCDSLESLDCSKFQTGSVQTVQSMFANCDALKEVDVSTWDMPKVENMSKMFYLDSQLESVNLKGVSIGSTTTMESMFDGCVALEKVDVSSFETPNVENMYQMFNKCSKLEKLDLSGFDMGKVTNSQNMLANDYALQEITVGEKFKFGPDPGLTVPDTHEVYGYYTGKWVRTDGQYAKTAAELMSGYDGATMAGTYVWQIDIEDAKISDVADCTFNGKAQAPELKLVVGEGDKALELVAGEDFYVESENVNAGEATVTVEPKGRCVNSGTPLTAQFQIAARNIADATVSAEQQTANSDGSAVTPDVSASIVLVEGEEAVALTTDDFDASYSDNVLPGTGKITLIGKGNYTGTAAGTFVIKPTDEQAAAQAVADKAAEVAAGTATDAELVAAYGVLEDGAKDAVDGKTSAAVVAAQQRIADAAAEEAEKAIAEANDAKAKAEKAASDSAAQAEQAKKDAEAQKKAAEEASAKAAAAQAKADQLQKEADAAKAAQETAEKAAASAKAAQAKAEKAAASSAQKNTMTVNAKTVKAKAKKTSTVNKGEAFTVKNAKGKVTFYKVSGNAKIAVSKAGKVTVKKGLKAGKTYKVKVLVSAAGDKAYAPSSKTVTLKVKVTK